MKFLPTLLLATLLIVSIVVSCRMQGPKNQQATTYINKLDTNKAIAELHIRESFFQLDSIHEKIGILSERIDTLELTYYFGFCDCQRWIVSNIHDRVLTEHKDLDKLDPRGQIEFNLDKHGYYIESATKELELDWRIHVNGTKVKFIGREYMGKGLPKDGGFTVPNPPHGKVFRYYSYEIIKPYKAWGPPIFTIDKKTGDTLDEPTILTVK